MRKEDLKVGTIYIAGEHTKFLNKILEITNRGFEGSYIENGQLYRNGGVFVTSNLKKASPEECHWLEYCIKKNEFIPYEEAMLSFNKNTNNNQVTPKLVKIWNKLLNKKNYYEKE